MHEHTERKRERNTVMLVAIEMADSTLYIQNIV